MTDFFAPYMTGMHWWDKFGAVGGLISIISFAFCVLTWLLARRERQSAEILKEEIKRLQSDDQHSRFHEAVGLAIRTDDALLKANDAIFRHPNDCKVAIEQLLKLQATLNGDLKAHALYIARTYPAELSANIHALGAREKSAILKELKIQYHALGRRQ